MIRRLIPLCRRRAVNIISMATLLPQHTLDCCGQANGSLTWEINTFFLSFFLKTPHIIYRPFKKSVVSRGCIPICYTLSICGSSSPSELHFSSHRGLYNSSHLQCLHNLTWYSWRRRRRSPWFTIKPCKACLSSQEEHEVSLQFDYP